MKIIRLLIAMLIPVTSLSQTLDTELDVLTKNYNKAVLQAVQPVNTKYELELRKLLDKYNKNNDVENSKRVLDILSTLPKYSSNVDKKFDFINKSWVSKVYTEFYFFENKTGYMLKFGKEPKQLFSWKKDSNLVVVVLDDTKETIYFDFNDSDSKFGKLISVIDQPLKLK